MELRHYQSSVEAIEFMTEGIMSMIKDNYQKGMAFNMALSGGGTAKLMFEIWAKKFPEFKEFTNVNYYWVDERMVPPSDYESNYKYAKELFIEPMGIQGSQVHRIRGEAEVEGEVERYISVVRGIVQNEGFDLVILGVGEDMHTASIFPNNMRLLESTASYSLSYHPISGQRRITMTGNTIINAKNVYIPVLKKPDVVRQLKRKGSDTPANYIIKHCEEAIVFTDGNY